MTPADLAATHAAAFTLERPWSESEFAGFLDRRFCFVAGDARCFALVRVLADEAELLTLATHPDHRRQGLARAVMADWMREAVQRGAAGAFLEVAADNTAAIALYDSCDFARCGTRRDYYRRPGQAAADAVLMSRALP